MMLALAFLVYFACCAMQGRSKKRVKMKKNSPSSKELLIDWLRHALDNDLYPGMKWLDKENGTFYVIWVHKSSEQWSDKHLAPFIAWALHKGKLAGKNPKQLKATFRCALNSKKELEEQGRDRDRRYWKFVDPLAAKKDKTPKKRRRNNKVTKTNVADMEIDNCNKDAINIINNQLLPLRINEDEISSSAKLPAFDSFSNFEPLTPPDQANENSFSCTDFKFSKEKEKLEKYNASSIEHVPANIPSVNVNRSLLQTTNEAYTALPPFETFCSFRNLTPPPQNNEVNFIPTEYRTNYTPPPEQSRLTPPQKSYHNSRDSYNPSSTELWQPNCWPVHQMDKETKGLSDFFASDFIEIYKSSNQEPEVNNCMDFLDMDQYVPVINASTNVQIHNKNGQSTLINRVPSSNPMQTDHSLEKLDDYLSLDNFDQEMCRRLMQELERTSLETQYRFLS